MSEKSHLARWPLFIVYIHWVSALLVFGLFAVGFYMVELDYYDPLYKVLPSWHKSVGLILSALILCRLLARGISESPPSLETHSALEKRIAPMAHLALYLLLFVVFISGYLISTADGRPIDVFNWFSLPALITGVANLEDYAGDVHYWATYLLVALATLHAIAALKHHFIDRDRTLMRMLGSRSPGRETQLEKT